METFSKQYMIEVQRIAESVDTNKVDAATDLLTKVGALGGRVFVIGVGGSAANASHFVNDLRKITRLEAYAPTDNVAELTARTNDEGWHSVFENWLRGSNLRNEDCLFILSVGGGSLVNSISVNIVRAMYYAKGVGAATIAIVGRNDGYAAKAADVCICIPNVNLAHVTPHSESFQSIVCHLLVSHPRLKQVETKWESL